jgi:chromosome segregation ATPase
MRQQSTVDADRILTAEAAVKAEVAAVKTECRETLSKQLLFFSNQKAAAVSAQKCDDSKAKANQAEKEALTQRLSKSSALLKRALDEVASTRKKLEETTQQRDKLRAALSQRNGALEGAETNLSEFREAKAEAETLQQEAETQVDDLQRQLMISTKEKFEAEKKLRVMQSNMENLKAEAKAAASAALETENELRNKLLATARSRKAVKAENEALQHRLTSAQGQHGNTIQETESRLHERDRQLQDVTLQVAAYETKLEALQTAAMDSKMQETEATQDMQTHLKKRLTAKVQSITGHLQSSLGQLTPVCCRWRRRNWLQIWSRSACSHGSCRRRWRMFSLKFARCFHLWT